MKVETCWISFAERQRKAARKAGSRGKISDYEFRISDQRIWDSDFADAAPPLLHLQAPENNDF
jgi:hypothetical protein